MEKVPSRAGRDDGGGHAGVDIRVIQVMLGHKKVETTSVYTHVATEVLREVVSPLEMLEPA